MWDHEITYAHRSSKDEQLLIRPLLQKNQKYKHGRQLKIKIHVWFYGDNSLIVGLRQMQLVQ
jgi:hypothetical protein